jgi:ParB-like chromosome segregation protein Spo0J
VLAQALREKGLTQEQIGERIGWSREQVKDYIKLINSIGANILEIAKNNQIGRAPQIGAIAPFNFTEGWFRNSGLYELFTKEEYKGLEKSLLEEGCRDALVTWNGTIVDGHNRYELCQKHGIDFDVVEKEFENENAAKTWIIQNQLARRNLPKYVYGELVLQLEPLLAKEAKQNQIQHKVINSSLSANSPKVKNTLPNSCILELDCFTV